MRVHTRVVIDMESLEVLYEEGFEYEGPVELCKGGGGSSGQVRYPAYVERIHEDWLDATGSDFINASVTEVMNDALGASPYAAATAYDPDADIASYIAAVGDFRTTVAALIGHMELAPTLPTVVSEADITADVANLESQVETLKDNRLTGTVIPRFEAGMRDVNAVVSSAFVIGRAVIESEADAEVTREAARHGSKLRIAVKATDAQVGELNLKEAELVNKAYQVGADFEKVAAQLMVEAYRIKIVAKKEEADTNQEYDVADAHWDLEVFQYGANVMASPAGGTGVPSGKKLTAGSVIGGALSGAAAGGIAGAMMGGTVMGMGAGPFGAIAGGLLGLGMGLMG